MVGGGGGGSPMSFMDEPVQQERIRVCLRLRPVNKLEQSRRSKNCVTVYTDGDKSKSKNSDGGGDSSILVDSPLEGEFNFNFDKVFQEQSSQSSVYDHAAAPLASDVLEGFNCALIAYGQTGSGKTHTMMGGNISGTLRSNDEGGEKGGSGGVNEETGMIHRVIKDVFRQMADSPPTVEYIVRCSFVEIYLEKILDLLNPVNRSIRILSGDGKSGESGMGSLMGGSSTDGVRMDGASEACCFDESDVISLLVRGNACRTVSSTKMNTDSSRSHAIFIMKIEQKDNSTGISKTSQLQMIDMAGSELGGKNKAVAGTVGTAIHQEARMINKSLSTLNAVVRTVASNQQASGGGDSGGGFHEVPYSHSKLTRLLRDAFGGNCRTSIILTASPASYNISESIRTMKFGHYCRTVMNSVKPSVEMSPVDYRKLLNDSQKKQGDLIDLVNELSAECFQLKQDAKSHKFVESNYVGPLWETVEAILVNGAAPVVGKSGKGGRRPGDSSEVAALREELAKAKDELENSKKTRENLENLLSERQSEVAVLRTQNDNYCSEKKKNAQELIAAKNEIRVLNQRKQEVEHNLRTSQFREYEATVFLRQFRRFYRRLLRNKAAQGTGGTSEVIEKVPGVPDLNDLIDVDSLLLESGLIEESELHDDTATGAYRPSAQALGRSTDASNKAWKEAAAQGKVDELEALDRSSLAGRKVGGNKDDVSELGGGGASTSNGSGGADAGAGSSLMPYGQTITSRQQFLGTPAGRLTIMRERELERDLLRATERCIELQVALNEEKANVEILTNRAGNLNKKKIAQDTIQLKQQLDKKTHDLQAIIWKMNELHLINKTYNEKMSNREQHVTYLEENLVELQSSNRNMILERQEAEEKLREELENLKVLVDAMTIPLWQFGECGVTGRTLANRIRLTVRGGEHVDEREKNIDGEESLDSLEESAASDDEDEDDFDESGNVAQAQDAAQAPAPAPVPVAPVQIITQKNIPMRDASTQTVFSQQERGTMTDALPVPQPPPRSTTRDINGAGNEVSADNKLSGAASKDERNSWQPKPSRDEDSSSQVDDGSKAEQTSAASRPASRVNPNIHGDGSVGTSSKASINSDDDTKNFQSEDLFLGGKPSSSQPRRFVHKFGLMIRPGVLKETSSKSKSDTSSRR